MDRWLWERGVIRIAQVKVGENTVRPWEIETQVNHMIDQYEELFQLSWPDEWKELVSGFIIMQLFY